MKWMKVQENQIYRSQEKINRFAGLSTKYEQRLKKSEKKADTKRNERCQSAKELQIKREMVKSYRDKAQEE